ncbi:hypothetical protein F7725_000331 [Dissostichus mawsoni]|uniref:Uncharacterized protein n=1 Tax=Dissostichus mawsoni TaxID=36200 RepID=A0A7J5ZEL1_DISMA|nr:hypothetical protein F7725_000331 [Dissostichus mawsoni]
MSGPRGCLTITRRGALASSRVMLFNRFTRRSGRGVATGLGPSLTTENSTSSPVWSSRPSCTSFTWKKSFLLSPTSYYLVFDTLHHGSALRDHVTGHLLSSLGYCAVLELHQLSFLQTIPLVRHSHDSKGITLAFICTWNNDRGMKSFYSSPKEKHFEH